MRRLRSFGAVVVLLAGVAVGVPWTGVSHRVGAVGQMSVFASGFNAPIATITRSIVGRRTIITAWPLYSPGWIVAASFAWRRAGP